VQKIDAKNQKTVYEYDDAGRLTEIRYFATADDTAPVKTVTFTYDRTGNPHRLRRRHHLGDLQL
jgi:hypothetical protein